ncbi:selenocysteine-specific translation elongation factor [Breznakiellaceae bacterium SP9]
MTMEYPFIFGTAGHIDHGKTALVRAMTGIDCDRLEEEKRRGITIELGFAPLHLPCGKTVSIVDVPGHERFIRTMASGAAGIDAAMLVIAASEGVMPQTREHLDILTILGVRSLLVVLTKKDLVDDETLELARSEAEDLLTGTTLAGSPIIPCSSVTGEGVPLILSSIEKIVAATPPRKTTGAFFLPIDRVFSKKGFGSVVTGTSYQGSLAEGDDVEIMPAGLPAKVRSLQTHSTKVPSVTAGQRVAINLSGVTHDKIERGAAVCAKGAFIATSCFSAVLAVLPSAKDAVSHWQRVRLHVGTADIVARVSLLRLQPPATVKDEPAKKSGIAPGQGGPVQFICESPITAAAGQRFVIRFYSPLITIGGGRILLPNAELARGRGDRAAKADIVEALAADFNPLTFLSSLIHDKGIVSTAQLLELSQMDKHDKESTAGYLRTLSTEQTARGLMEFGAGPHYIAACAFETVVRSCLQILHEFHAKTPERAGLDAEELFPSINEIRGAARLKIGDFKELLSSMLTQKSLVQVSVQGKNYYRAADTELSIDTKLLTIALTIKKTIAAAGFNLLRLSELEETLGISSAEAKRAAAYLREQEDLRVLEGGFLFPVELRDKLLTCLAAMENGITLAKVRDTLGTGRKDAAAMLEFLDNQGYTQRTGDMRILTEHLELRT